MSSIFKLFRPILRGFTRTYGGEEGMRKSIHRRIVKCRPPVEIEPSRRVRVIKKRNLSHVALRKLIDNLHLYHVKFRVFTKLPRNKALVVFNRNHKPSKVKRLEFSKERKMDDDQLKKDFRKNLISGIVIFGSFIEQSSKVASLVSHTYQERKNKNEGGIGAIKDMGRDFFGLLEKNDLKESLESKESLLAVSKGLTESANLLTQFKKVFSF